MTKTERRATRRKQTSLVFVSVGLIVILFLTYWLVLSRILPDGRERGLFGDAFGALNALLSGVALIGVVYALLLQQKQLAEMRRSFVLQQQPVLEVNGSNFRIDRPRLFTSPNRNGCDALSRYHCRITVSNVSEIPAVNAVLTATLFYSVDGVSKKISSVGHHIPLVTAERPQEEDVMFVPEEPYDMLFRVLRNRDVFALPQISIQVAYRNLMGACFAIGQAYHVVPTPEVCADLKVWHGAVVAFPAQHQEQVIALADGSAPAGLFDELQQAFGGGLGDRESLSLDLVGIPGTFEARTMCADDYGTYVNSVGVPHLTFSDTKCPIEKSKHGND